MRRGFIGTVMLLSIAFVVVPARATIPVLGAVNVITASTARRMTVSVPRDVTISDNCFRLPSVRIEGPGDLPGIVLLPDTSDRRSDPIVIARLPSGAGSVVIGSTVPSDCVPFVIHKGVYLLYALPGGGPIRVTLPLPGLTGTTQLAPTTPVVYQVKTHRPTLWKTPTGSLWAAGGTGSLRSIGMLFTVVWANMVSHQAAQAGACWTYGAPRYPMPVTFSPGCPFASSFIVTDTVSGRNRVAYAAVANYPLSAGVYGQGGYRFGAEITRAEGATSFWLSYG